MFINPVMIAANIILELLMIRAHCRSLKMISNLLFGTLTMLMLSMSVIMISLGVPDPVRMILIMPASSLIIPIALSEGPLSRRLIRIGAFNIGTLFTELVSIAASSVLFGTAYIRNPKTADLSLIAIIYAVDIFITALVFEVLTWYFNHLDDEDHLRFELPVIILMLGSFLMMAALIVRIDITRFVNPVGPMVALAFATLTLCYGVATHSIATKDARAQRVIADRMALVRQNRHVQTQIESAIRRSTRMRYLRHDLANQVGVVSELAAQGRLEEADRYLANLQERAHELCGDDHA